MSKIQKKSFFSTNQFKEAATIVAKAKALRNDATIAKFQAAPQQPGQPLPLLVYFSTLLEKAGKLNKTESVQLCQLVVQQGRDPAITVTTVLTRQADDRRRQRLLVIPVDRLIALCRPGQPQNAASMAFRD